MVPVCGIASRLCGVLCFRFDAWPGRQAPRLEYDIGLKRSNGLPALQQHFAFQSIRIRSHEGDLQVAHARRTTKAGARFGGERIDAGVPSRWQRFEYWTRLHLLLAVAAESGSQPRRPSFERAHELQPTAGNLHRRHAAIAGFRQRTFQKQDHG
jgi:hypothetical protein